jgi:kynurenine formamidase
MAIIDLSTTIEDDPDKPPVFRTEISYTGHDAGAQQIHEMLGVPSRLLRDGEGWSIETLHLGTHNSTHVDAPWHYNSTIGGEAAATIDELPLEWFWGDGVVLDMRGKEDGDAMTEGDARAELERIGYTLRPLDIVLVRTGCDAYYKDADYMRRGCGVTAAATHWLYDQGVRVMGIDAWGWDRPLHLQAEEALARQEKGIFWAAHQVDLAYSQIERLMNLGALPAFGFKVSCFPLKVRRGSAAPARVVAILADETDLPNPT